MSERHCCCCYVQRQVIDISDPLSLASPIEPSMYRFLLEWFLFGLENFCLLTPLACCMWGVNIGRRMLQLTRVVSQIPCYHLDVGEPEDTAILVESLLQETNN